MSQKNASNPEEAISLSAAARELNGSASYAQLYKLVKTGKICATQPYGKHGHYRVTRRELERVITPVTGRQV